MSSLLAMVNVVFRKEAPLGRFPQLSWSKILHSFFMRASQPPLSTSMPFLKRPSKVFDLDHLTEKGRASVVLAI